jgi:hypothetical protein
MGMVSRKEKGKNDFKERGLNSVVRNLALFSVAVEALRFVRARMKLI